MGSRIGFGRTPQEEGHDQREDVPAPKAWSDINETISIPKPMIREIILIAEAGLENAQELLDNHLHNYGEGTTKNKFIAKLYRDEIIQCHKMLACLIPQAQELGICGVKNG